MRVSSVHVYPVKATAGLAVDSAEVETAGLRHDRRWAIVDGEGKRLNATHHDSLLRVVAQPDDAGNLTVSVDGRDPVFVPTPVDGPSIRVNVSRYPHALDAGDEAAHWFGEYLERPVRLVWQDDPAKRPMSVNHGGTGAEPLSLADTGPLLLTSVSSLSRLNEWVREGDNPEQLVMERFRPNVVIDGIDEPFAEDGWRAFRIGDVRYRFAEHCDRCVVTNIDPRTLKHGKEPIRTLARHRKWDGKTWFGIRIVPLDSGALSVGDTVSVG